VSFPNVQCLAGLGERGLLGLVNLFSGGALLQLSIFALGVMPYITATIIVQLLRVVIPHFEALYKEGRPARPSSRSTPVPDDRARAAVHDPRHGRALGPALRQTGIASCNALLTNDVWWAQLLMIITLTAGTGLIMWFAELVTERASATACRSSSSPRSPRPSRRHVGDRQTRGFEVFLLVLLVGIVVVASSSSSSSRSAASRCSTPSAWSDAAPRRHQHLHPDQGEHGGRRSRSSSPRRCCTSRCSSRSSTIPQDGKTPPAWATWIMTYFVKGDHPLYMLLYFLLIVGFTYFYVAITFNPVEVADNMKKYGGFIPGIRAGRPTAEYLDYVLTRITLPDRSTSAHRADPADRAGHGRREPELPVRRRLDPDHRRRRSGDGQADRRAAAAATLRRAPDDGIRNLHRAC
jgi:preprotein translocase subunit SecY